MGFMRSTRLLHISPYFCSDQEVRSKGSLFFCSTSRGVEGPTAVFGSVMHREALPQQVADLLTKSVHRRFAVMRAQVAHDEVDGVGP